MADEPQTADAELRDRAVALKRIIDAEAADAPAMARSAILERAADRLCGDQWDWTVATSLGGTCEVIITAYRGRV